MTWNWSRNNTIVFTWWSTSSTIGLLTACLTVVLISCFYELVAGYQRYLDQKAFAEDRAFSSLSLAYTPPSSNPASPSRATRAAFYGIRCYLGILLMLIMMTFNGFLILSIVIGAMVGHYLLGVGTECH